MRFTSIVLLALALTPAASAAPEELVTIHSVLDHYEAVRDALVNDSAEGVATHVASIQEGIATLHHSFDEDAAGVSAENRAKALELLGKVHIAASGLGAAAESGELGAIREAFYELTKPLVLYRELMIGDKPVVAYCPMAKKSWLQDDEEIGNPYAGQSMPTCGSVVSGGR